MKTLALAVKEFKSVFRETGGLLVMFLMPIAFLVVFNLIFAGMWNDGSNDSPFKIPVVNLDQGEMGAKVVAALENVKYVKVETKFEDGKLFTEEEAIKLVADGKRNQVLILPAEFTEKIMAGEKIDLPLYVDPALPVQYAGPVQGSILGALFSTVFSEQMKQQFPDRIVEGMDKFEKQFGIVIPPKIREELKKGTFLNEYILGEESAEENGKSESTGFLFDEDALLAKLDIRQPPAIKREQFPSVYQQNLSAYSVISIFFIISAIGSGFFDEQKFGTFRRILAMPLGKASFLTGKLLPYIFINFLQVAVLVFLSVVLYGCDLGQHPEAFIFVTFCTALSASGMGLMMVTLFKSYTKMSSVSTIVVLMASALSGAFVPRFVMGDFIQKISLVVPQSWAIMAYQNVMVRGKGVFEVMPECLALLGFSAVFFLIGLWRFSYQDS